MFDIGFSEIMVIAVVALIVIGPERLPKVARTLGHLFGRMQRYVNDVKADIGREMQLEELRNLQSSMQDAARSIEQSVSREVTATESELQEITETTAPETAHSADGPSPDTSPTPPGIAHPSTAAPASPQLELGLDSKPPKQA
jgi:sec-independent protein translocase protein TatB